MAERGRRLFSLGSPPPLPEPGHRRIATVASLSGALPLPFLPPRVGAHLPTPSARQLSGHPCGSLSSSSRFSAALGPGGGGRGPQGSVGGGFDGGAGEGGFEPPILATLDRRGLLCFPWKLLEEVRGRGARQASISVLRTEVGGPRRLHLCFSSRGLEGPGSQSDAPSGSVTKLMWWHLDSHGLACLPRERRQYWGGGGVQNLCSFLLERYRKLWVWRMELCFTVNWRGLPLGLNETLKLRLHFLKASSEH